MKARIFWHTAIAISILGFTTVPATAQQVTPSHSQTELQAVTLSQSTAIVVVVPNSIQFEVTKDGSYPTTLLLAQPVLDGYGNIVAEANSPLQARVLPTDDRDGVQILVEALVIGGQSISVQALSSTIPTQRAARDGAMERDQHNAEVFGRLGGSVAGAIDGGNTNGMMRGGLIGNIVGLVGGLTSSHKTNIAYIPQGSVYVLTLKSPVTLSAVPPAGQPTPQQTSSSTISSVEAHLQVTPQQPSAGQSEFSFRNSLQYANTLEQIISAYQQKQISASDAHSRVEAADRFATRRLTQQLFPPAGVRQQIRQLFAFTYAIDR